MDVSIIIVNYNTKVLTINCVQSILDFTKDVSYEIIVVDNASTDGTLSEVGTLYPDIKIIGLQENVGFGRANNAGSEVAKGEFLFFLNSDTLLVENSLKKMIDFFRSHEKSLNLGVLGCILVDEQLKTNGFGSNFPNPNTFLQESLRKIPLVRNFVKSDVSISYDVSSEFFNIDYVIGADMLMKRSLFNYFNGFDKDYFMYYEESDMQLRLFRNGYENYIYSGTKIIHLEDGSGKSQLKYSNRKRIILHQSKITYMQKNFGREYSKFKSIDIITLILNIFNKRYTFAENVKYVTAIISKY
ncbi:MULTISPECIES: glycosyltransferase family 2 protein [Sphingobacterium]|uniref:glycosyltransferase family 2 protein n=1 Tax=Sphingobacterium TaxID=28453 RepID=UPI0025802DA0|nr:MULTISPECIES: glycosyltransferase family 2 protein [Sphingobacterium]